MNIEKKPINGILLVNKPQGLSSNAVLQRVKKLFNAKKAGHTGSLDPLATGMLPICFGEATKICQFLLDADKAYVATGKLGIKTSTGDSEGEIIEQVSFSPIDEVNLQKAIKQFLGEIQQIPPMYSALKHQGMPLYKLARNGQTIERKPRSVIIQSIELLDYNGSEFTVKVACSKGTYIRSLIEDIGEMLGVYAHVTSLHRLYTNGFENQTMYTLEQLYDFSIDLRMNCLHPLESAITYLPILMLTSEKIIQLQQGKILSNYSNFQGLIRLHSELGDFVGLGDVDNEGTLKVKRLLAY